MTTTETLKLALEALETGGWNKTTAAITALREALASQGEALTSVPDWASEAIEQKSGIKQVIELYDSPDQPAPVAKPHEQEPVAWICEGSSSDEKHAIDYWPGDIEDIPIGTKLYTSPPASKPLTDEEIESINVRLAGNRDLARLFARAIEAAHGIKENT